MPGIPNKLSQFWQELKRRNVLRSLAIYAGTAFVILEASTIIFPRWDLPDWTIDLVLYLLILGMFVTAIVAWIFDITPQGVQKTKPLEEATDIPGHADSKVWKAATYISLVIIAALIVVNIIPIGNAVKTGDIQSLVILPFDNFTGDDELNYFVSGMHASLIGDMGRVGGLRVISKTSSNTYKGVEKSIPEIASELAVDAVMEAQVMCVGDTVCFQLRLVTPFPEEKLLWAADYREEKSQILNLYNRVTRQIAEEVRIELTPEEDRVLNQSRTVNKEAYDAYLMGMFYWDKLSQEELDHLSKMVGLNQADNLRYREWMSQRMQKALRFSQVREAIQELAELLAQMGMNRERVEQLRQLLQANQKGLEDQLRNFAGQKIAENMVAQYNPLIKSMFPPKRSPLLRTNHSVRLHRKPS